MDLHIKFLKDSKKKPKKFSPNDISDIKKIIDGSGGITDKIHKLEKYIDDIMTFYLEEYMNKKDIELGNKKAKEVTNTDTLRYTVLKFVSNFLSEEKEQYNKKDKKAKSVIIKQGQVGGEKKYNTREVINRKINEVLNCDDKKNHELKELIKMVLFDASNLSENNFQELLFLINGLLETISKTNCEEIVKNLLMEDYLKLPNFKNTKICNDEIKTNCVKTEEESIRNSKINKVIAKFSKEKNNSVSKRNSAVSRKNSNTLTLFSAE